MKAQQGIRFEIWVNQQQMKKFFNIKYYKIHFLIYQLDRFVMSDVFDLLSFWLSPNGNCCKGSKVEVTERKQQKTGRKKVFRTSRCVQAESHFYEENCCKKREEGKVFIFHLLLGGGNSNWLAFLMVTSYTALRAFMDPLVLECATLQWISFDAKTRKLLNASCTTLMWISNKSRFRWKKSLKQVMGYGFVCALLMQTCKQ